MEWLARYRTDDTEIEYPVGHVQHLSRHYVCDRFGSIICETEAADIAKHIERCMNCWYQNFKGSVNN